MRLVLAADSRARRDAEQADLKRKNAEMKEKLKNTPPACVLDRKASACKRRENIDELTLRCSLCCARSAAVTWCTTVPQPASILR